MFAIQKLQGASREIAAYSQHTQSELYHRKMRRVDGFTKVSAQ